MFSQLKTNFLFLLLFHYTATAQLNTKISKNFVSSIAAFIESNSAIALGLEYEYQPFQKKILN